MRGHHHLSLGLALPQHRRLSRADLIGSSAVGKHWHWRTTEKESTISHAEEKFASPLASNMLRQDATAPA